MACSYPQQVFNALVNLEASVNVSGGTAQVLLRNTGHNILQLSRMQFGATFPDGGAAVWFLRPPQDPPITPALPLATLEQGSGVSFSAISGLPAGSVVEVQVEYTEVECRSRSCQVTV
jgi:hypothetical protein